MYHIPWGPFSDQAAEATQRDLAALRESAASADAAARAARAELTDLRARLASANTNATQAAEEVTRALADQIRALLAATEADASATTPILGEPPVTLQPLVANAASTTSNPGASKTLQAAITLTMAADDTSASSTPGLPSEEARVPAREPAPPSPPDSAAAGATADSLAAEIEGGESPTGHVLAELRAHLARLHAEQHALQAQLEERSLGEQSPLGEG